MGHRRVGLAAACLAALLVAGCSGPGGATADRDGELETWLSQVEDDVEGYRTAYKSLTGVDLGEKSSRVEQQA